MLPQVLLAGGNQICADRLLEAEDQPGADGLDDRGGAAFLPGDWVVEVAVADGVDEGHGAAARDGGHRVAHQVAAHDQDARGLRPAGELVRRQEHRVLVVASAGTGHGNPDRHVGPCGGVIPERQGTMGVQQRRDPAGVGENAGHVGRGRETADQQRPAGEPGHLPLQVGQVDVAVGVLADDHHLGDRLAPGELVGVVLVRADEHHRPLACRDLPGELVPVVQAGRDAQLEDADELVHRGGRAGPAEDDQVIVGAADRTMNDLAGVLAQPGRLQAGAGALGVSVGIPRQHLLAGEVLDEVQSRGPAGERQR